MPDRSSLRRDGTDYDARTHQRQASCLLNDLNGQLTTGDAGFLDSQMFEADRRLQRGLVGAIGLIVAAAGGFALAAAFPNGADSAAAASKRGASTTFQISLGGVTYRTIGVDLSLSFQNSWSFWTEYGLTSAYGTACCEFTEQAGQGIIGTGALGLTDGTTYHLRVGATDGTETVYSNDLVAATRTSEPPIIDWYPTPPGTDVRTIDVIDERYETPYARGSIQLNTKGEDTSWYVAAGADLSSPTWTSPTSTFRGIDQDVEVTGGDLDYSFALGRPLPRVVYVQLHASNARGSSVSSVLTYTTGTSEAATTTAMTTTAVSPHVDETRPALASTELPAASVGVPYSVKLALTDGSPPYMVVLNGGQEVMPPGLHLSSDGVVSGTPTSEGSYRVNIKVFDQRYPPTIGPASVFTLTGTIDGGSGAAGTTAAATTTATPAVPPWWKNCALLNKRYPHGIGRVGAVDKTQRRRVTNFKRSNALYAFAVHHNPSLDRDKDRIACERQ
jgi:hypothetical protein